MLIYKHKTESGIFKKYLAKTGLGKYVYFENIFTKETIGPRVPYKRKFTHLLSESGKWKESDFYVVSER